MTEKEKMLSGKAYIASDEELVRERKYARKLARLFNQTTEEDDEERNVVIGSGSVVTKNIPANCVAVGNPCKVIKTL